MAAKAAEQIDVRDQILEHMKNDERDLAYLSRKTKINYHTLYSCFIQRLFKISDENLVKINAVLKKEFKQTP